MAGANLGTASGRIEIDGSGAAKGFQMAEAAADAFFGAIQDKVSRVEELGTKLQAVGAASAGGFALAINSAASFEQKLSGIEAVSGATEAQMGKISKAALRIGADTTYSASEAASAIEEIIKAGVSVEDTLNGAADATVALAAAGGVSLPEAATIASNALNAFNLTGQDMASVADTIAGAANASAIDVGQFGQSLSQSGAVAHLAGIDFDDLAVAIAEMGQAGIKGSDAGTSIKTFLQNLIPTTNDQISAFKRLGLVSVGSQKALDGLAAKGIKPVSKSYDDVRAAISKYVEESGGAEVGTAKNNKETQRLGSELGVLKNQFFDAQGNAKDFASIQGELAKATAGMTKEQKLQTLELLFGSDAIRAAAVFADQGASGFDKMAASMSKVTAAQVASTRLDNFRGSVEQLRGALETAAITIGSVFLPIARKIVDVITSVVNSFNNAPAGVQRFLAIMASVGAVLAALVGTLLTLIGPIALLLTKFLGFAALKSIFSIFTSGFAVFRSGAGVVAALGATLARAGAVFGRFGAIALRIIGILARIPGVFLALRAVAGVVFGPIGLAISLVVTALVLLYKHSERFRGLVDGIARAVQGGFLKALNYAQMALYAFMHAFREGDVTSDGFIGFVERLGVAVRPVGAALAQLAQAFTGRLLPALRAAGKALGGQLLSAWSKISAAAQGQLLPAFRQLGTALAPLVPYLRQFGVFLLKAAGAAVIAGVSLAAGMLVSLIRIATVIVGTVLPAVVKFIAILLGGLLGALTAVVSGVTTVVTAIASFVAGVVNGMTGAADATSSGAARIGSVLASIGGFFVAAFGAVRSVVVGVFTAVWSFITTAVAGISNGIQVGLAGIAGFFTTAFSAVRNVVVTVFTAVRTAITTALTAISTAITTGLAVVGALWSSFWSSSFGQLVSNAIGLVVDVVKLGLALLYLAFAVTVATVRVLWSNLWNGLTAAASAVWGAISSAVTTGLAAVAGVVTAGMTLVRTAVTTAWAAVRAATAAAVAAVVGVVAAAWGGVRSATAAAWSAISSVVSAAWSRIRSIASSAGAAVRSVVVAAWNAVRSATAPVWNAVASAVSSAMNRVRAVVSSVSGAVRSAITSAWNAARSATISAWNGIASAVSGAVSRFMGIVRSIHSQVVGAFAGAASWLISAGRNVVQGLINGISGMIGAARAKVQELASVARSAATAALGIHSPSTVFRDIGRYVGDGFVQGLNGSASKVKAASQKMSNLVQRYFDQKGVKGNGKGLIDRIGKTEKKLLALAKSREKTAEKLKAAKSKLEDAIKLRDDYAKQVQDSFTAIGNVTKFETNGKTSAGAIIAGMRDALVKAQRFASYVAKLRKLGLNKQSLSDILAAGPDAGYETARALADGGKAAIKEVNGLQANLTQQGKNVGTTVAKQFYGAGVQAAQGLVNGLKSREKQLIAQAEHIANVLSRAIKRALKIHSPSRVMAGLGSFSIEGFVEGIESQYKALEQAMAGVAGRTAVTPHVAGLRARPLTPVPVTSFERNGPTVHQDIKIINPERVRDSKDTDRSLQLAGAFFE